MVLNTGELQKVLKYKEWRNFKKVLDKSRSTCGASNYNIIGHFVEVNKPVKVKLGIFNWWKITSYLDMHVILLYKMEIQKIKLLHLNRLILLFKLENKKYHPKKKINASFAIADIYYERKEFLSDFARKNIILM